MKMSNVFVLCFFNMLLSHCRTDPRLPDMPIVYASDAFLRLTGAQRFTKITIIFIHSMIISNKTDLCVDTYMTA